MSRERAQVMASRQLASVGSETTVERTLRRRGFRFWNGANLCRTLRMGGRFGIPKRQVSEGEVQRLWGDRKSEPYIFHRGQPCHIGIGKDSDLCVKRDKFLGRDSAGSEVQTLRAFMFLRSIPTSAVTPSPNRKLEAAS